MDTFAICLVGACVYLVLGIGLLEVIESSRRRAEDKVEDKGYIIALWPLVLLACALMRIGAAP